MKPFYLQRQFLSLLRLLPLFLLVGCTTLKLKPFSQPAGETSVEDRKQIYDNLKVSVVEPNPSWFNNLRISRFSRRMLPKLKSQDEILSTVNAVYLENYYRSSGALEAAELAKKANTKFWTFEGLNLLGSVLVAGGLIYSLQDFSRPAGIQSPWMMGGVTAIVLGQWALYSSSVDYLLPSTDSFNRFLRGKLKLEADPLTFNPGLRLAWNY